MIVRLASVRAASRLAARRCSTAAASSSQAVPPPTREQLYRHAVCAAIPMIGFGLIDNIVMIQAGDLIDNTIGVTLGLSTLTAAAYGQVVSDTAGTLFGNAIDAFFARLGLSPPNLSPAQRGLQKVRVVGTLSATAGVICGCLLGMTSLLLMDLEKGERLKKQREMRTLFATLMEEGHKTLGAEHCALYLVDRSDAGRQDGPPTPVALIERGSPPTRASDATTGATDADDDLPRLYAMGAHGRPPTDHELQRAFAAYDADGSGKIGASELFSAMTKLGRMVSFAQVQQMLGEADHDGDDELDLHEFKTLVRRLAATDEVRIQVRRGGTRHRVFTTGEALSIGDLGADARAAADVHMRLEARGEHMLRGYDVHSLLIAPVIDADGTVIGMIELVNKDPNRRRDGVRGWAFTKEDERLLGMLCSHCAIFLRNLE